MENLSAQPSNPDIRFSRENVIRFLGFLTILLSACSPIRDAFKANTQDKTVDLTIRAIPIVDNDGEYRFLIQTSGSNTLGTSFSTTVVVNGKEYPYDAPEGTILSSYMSDPLGVDAQDHIANIDFRSQAICTADLAQESDIVRRICTTKP